ncbi:hypothetical protein SAV31267_025620 [Streptomyces avermitilis]|uniref:Uncharacterized protein n=1 Tax=Streptomyces avermitilis TaxID=33903 RepID=A0A4D4MPI0_STRAX|nr:hypothetical protein SAV31267_025620 [Streptomyces avermitilis]
MRHRADVRLPAPHTDAHGLHAGHLHGPVAQRQRGGFPVQSGPYVGVCAAHRQEAAQTGSRGEHEQPDAEGGGETRADEHPGVVEGPLGELTGQESAPVHGGPVGAYGHDVVQEEAGAEEDDQGEEARRDTAGRPEAAVAGALVGGRDRARFVGLRGGGPAGVRVVGLLDDRQPLRALVSLVSLGLAHCVLPCAAPGAGARCSRSTWTATSCTSIPVKAPTRSAT